MVALPATVSWSVIARENVGLRTQRCKGLSFEHWNPSFTTDGDLSLESGLIVPDRYLAHEAMIRESFCLDLAAMR
jgi:hypothetical protein